MWRTRVGYAGGSLDAPTYRSMGDHTESFQVDFDPAVVSYDDLLETFWTTHDPLRAAPKTQYASLVLAHDDEQLEAARASAARLSAVIRRPVVTRIERLGRFWLAEDYHQKYYLRNDRVLAEEFQEMFEGDETALRESTAAARVNGYVAGDGTTDQLSREIDFLGLSEHGRLALIARVGHVSPR